MTPEEIVLTPGEIRAEDTNTDAARELSDLLAESAPAEIPQPAPQPAAAPVQPQAAKPDKKKPHILLRIPLQLLSLALALALFVTTLAGALVLDVRQLTSAGGIKQLINAAMDVLTGAPAELPREGAYISGLSNRTVYYDEAEDSAGGLEDSLGGEDLDISVDDIPEDILTGDTSEEGLGSLIDWLYDQVEDATGEELPISKEDVQTFVEESTFSDFVSEKLADFADDFINGTNNTTISADEIMELLEENEELLKEQLQIELTPDVKEELQGTMEDLVEESGINNIIREEVFGAVDEMLEESTASMGVSMDEIRSGLQYLTSPAMLMTVIGINVGILLLLCLLNFYNVPAGLTWAAFPCILSGGLLSLPLVVMGSVTVEGGESIVSVLSSFVDLFKPIHFGLLAIGVGLLVISIVWRVIRSAHNAK